MPGFAEGDWCVDTAMGEIAKLTPFIAGDRYAYRIFGLTIESLLQLDPMTLEWSPSLAATMPKVDTNIEAYNKFMDEQLAKGKKREEVLKEPALPVPGTMTFNL